MGRGAWPAGEALIGSREALWVGVLLIIAAAGKSALVPFSGWLPRAMEGPTSSSAIFYGALSVHLGAFLLLRISPILERSIVLQGTVVVLGAVTALLAALAGRVQSDVKTALAYASLTQVGIIVMEIGLGLRYVALVHILGHAALRTLQLLRAPTLLHDYHVLENALGHHLPRRFAPWNRWLPPRWQQWLYLLALERGFLDEILNRLAVRPFLALFHRFDAWERRWTDWLTGGDSRESDRVPLRDEIIEELRY
jgi:NAD(P)H-quinone oxidoreductase subunit 5